MSFDFDISKFDTTKEAINGIAGRAYQIVNNDNLASSVGLSISLNRNKKKCYYYYKLGKLFYNIWYINNYRRN